MIFDKNQKLSFSEIIRGGESLGDLPGVLLSGGQTWTEMRRSSLHVLRDLHGAAFISEQT